MKIAVLIFYIVISLIYNLFSDGSIEWDGINIITQYFAIAFISWFLLQRHRLNVLGRLLIKYSIGFNVLLTILTAACTWANIGWVYKSVYWCTVFMGVVFVATLAYGWIKHSNELGKR